MDDYIADIIIEESTSYFCEDLLEHESFANLNSIAQDMRMWLKDIQALNKDFKSLRTIAKNLEKQTQDVSRLNVFPETKVKLLKKINSCIEKEVQDNYDAEEILQRGYYLIHSFREVLTGQEIKYKVLFNRKQGTQDLAELSLNLDEVLSLAKITKNSAEKDFSLYINAASARLAENKKIGTLNEIDEHQYKLFYGIQQVWESPPQVRGFKSLGTTPNKGRIYEVYTKYKNQFSLPFGKSERSRIYWSLRKAVGENVPGWAQGDYGLQQLKTVIDNSTASLMSFNQAENIIRETLNALENSRKDKTKITNLIKIYTTQGIKRGKLKDIDKDVRDKALDYINENFLKFLTK